MLEVYRRLLARHHTCGRLTSGDANILELLAEPGAEDIEFDAPRLGESISRPADFA